MPGDAITFGASARSAKTWGQRASKMVLKGAQNGDRVSGKPCFIDKARLSHYPWPSVLPLDKRVCSTLECLASRSRYPTDYTVLCYKKPFDCTLAQAYHTDIPEICGLLKVT